MRDIFKICYQTIRQLQLTQPKEEVLLRELSERGFTPQLKERLLSELVAHINNLSSSAKK